jgi:hypothetical protein
MGTVCGAGYKHGKAKMEKTGRGGHKQHGKAREGYDVADYKYGNINDTRMGGTGGG